MSAISSLSIQLSEWPSQNFTAIAESMLAITSKSEIESFFLAKGLAQLLNKHSNEVYEELIQIYHRWLSGGQNTNKLYRLVVFSQILSYL